MSERRIIIAGGAMVAASMAFAEDLLSARDKKMEITITNPPSVPPLGFYEPRLNTKPKRDWEKRQKHKSKRRRPTT